MRANPCRGRYAGCTADPNGKSMCESCAKQHAAKAATKRAARKQKRCCWVCGATAAVVNGVTRSACETHLEYYAERARA